MEWNIEKQVKYQQFAKQYISNYSTKIDCADLGISALVDFSKQESLPIRFKYYSNGWQWISYAPLSDDADIFKISAMRMLGALNIIDNTKKISISASRGGDFIMSRWSNSLGHTRVIHTVTPIKDKFKVVWYQGNLPAVIPEKREELFSNIEGVFDKQPRRWNFAQFSE